MISIYKGSRGRDNQKLEVKAGWGIWKMLSKEEPFLDKNHGNLIFILGGNDGII